MISASSQWHVICHFAGCDNDRSKSSNENKMSDGGRGRAPLRVEVWKSSQKWSVQRSAVRSIVWLGVSASKPDCVVENPSIAFLNRNPTQSKHEHGNAPAPTAEDPAMLHEAVNEKRCKGIACNG